MNADARRKINGSELSGLIRLYPILSDLIRVPLPLTLFFLFGSGWSGLGVLREIPFQVVRIFRSLTATAGLPE